MGKSTDASICALLRGRKNWLVGFAMEKGGEKGCREEGEKCKCKWLTGISTIQP